MKTRLLVMVGMMISTTIFAQRADRDSRKPGNSGYERMKHELALSDKQYASIKDIDFRYSKKQKEERARFERRRFEERETMRSLRMEREREMRKVFTPAQSKQWDEFRAMQKNKKHFRNGKSKHDGCAHKHFGKDRRDKRNARFEMKQKG